MMKNTSHTANEYQDMARRIHLIWVAIMVVAPLALTGSFYLLFSFNPVTTPAEQPPLLSPALAYTSLLGLCGLFLLGTRPLANLFLSPERLSTLTLRAPAAQMTREKEVSLRVQTGVMRLLGIIDLPILLAVFLSYMDAEIGYALLAVGYGLLSTATSRPDLNVAARQLEQRLATSRSNASSA